MKRWMMRALLVGVMTFVLGSSTCTSSGYRVSYGYSAYPYGDPYGDVFYRRPIDHYGGFYGHP